MKDLKTIYSKCKCIWLLTFVLVMLGCSNADKKDNSFFNKNYIRSISIAQNSFSDTLIAHFPDAVDSKYSIKAILPKNDKKSNRYGLTLFFESTSQFISKIELSLNTKKKIGFNDKCSIVVGSTNNVNTSNVECVDFSLVPNIPEIFQDKTQELNIEKYDFYILGSLSGEFIEEQYLTDGVGLPEEWKNGYSKGIAINKEENYLIFWLEIW